MRWHTCWSRRTTPVFYHDHGSIHAKLENASRAFVRAINRQDVEGLAALMAPEHRFVDSLGNAVEGQEKMRAGWAAYFRMVPDYSIAVEECFGNGPVVVMLGMVQGTYTHPSDEDLSPHPKEQRSLAGGPESPGTPAGVKGQ